MGGWETGDSHMARMMVRGFFLQGAGNVVSMDADQACGSSECGYHERD